MPGHKNKVDIKDFAVGKTPTSVFDGGQSGFSTITDTRTKPQLGNVNEDNTIASLVYSGPVIKQGFNLAKKAPNIIKRVINKGKDFASTRIGRLAMKHADDVFNVVSSSGGLNK